MLPGIMVKPLKRFANERCYFTNSLYDPADPDEVQRSWNDERIILKIINGKKGDSRCGKRWSWFRPVH